MWLGDGVSSPLCGGEAAEAVRVSEITQADCVSQKVKWAKKGMKPGKYFQGTSGKRKVQRPEEEEPAVGGAGRKSTVGTEQSMCPEREPGVPCPRRKLTWKHIFAGRGPTHGVGL